MPEFGQDNVPSTSGLSKCVKRPTFFTNTYFLALHPISTGLQATAALWVTVILNNVLPWRHPHRWGWVLTAFFLKGKKQDEKLKGWCGHDKLTQWQSRGCNKSYPKSTPSQPPPALYLYWLLTLLVLGHVSDLNYTDRIKSEDNEE